METTVSMARNGAPHPPHPGGGSPPPPLPRASQNTSPSPSPGPPADRRAGSFDAACFSDREVTVPLEALDTETQCAVCLGKQQREEGAKKKRGVGVGGPKKKTPPPPPRRARSLTPSFCSLSLSLLSFPPPQTSSRTPASSPPACTASAGPASRNGCAAWARTRPARAAGSGWARAGSPARTRASGPWRQPRTGRPAPPGLLLLRRTRPPWRRGGRRARP